MSKTKTASISVVIPTTDAGAHRFGGGKPNLKRAIKSCGDLPTIVEQDPNRTGAGPTRNRAIERVDTDWVGFLDDDDYLTEDYYDRFREELTAHPEADVIIFRMNHAIMGLVPRIPEIVLGNVGISYCLKTELAKKHPFIKEDPPKGLHEDFQNLVDLSEAGANIVFSKHMVYKVGKKEKK